MVRARCDVSARVSALWFAFARRCVSALYFSKERAGVADVDVQYRAVVPVRALDGQGLHRGEDVEFGGCGCKSAD